MQVNSGQNGRHFPLNISNAFSLTRANDIHIPKYGEVIL